MKVFFKKDSISFVFVEKDLESYFGTLDYQGRLVSVFKNSFLYRRGYDNSVLRTNSSLDEYTFLPEEQKRELIENFYSNVRNNVSNLEKYIPSVSSINYEFLKEDGRKFRSIYKPITILPPDQYLALYIPLTEGCSYNKCAFCNLYRDRNFRIKTPSETLEITQKIVEFFKSSLLTRRSIFIGEGNVLVEDTNMLIENIRTTKSELSKVRKFLLFDFENEIYGFMDTFHTKKNQKDFQKLKESGLKRVYIGLETGNNFILQEILNKPSSSDQVSETVENIKKSEINVGIIVISGVGGKELQDKHLRDTVNIVQKMKLSKGDIVYISPLVVYPNLDIRKNMTKNNLTELSEKELLQETNTLVNILKKILSRDVKVSTYRVDRFIY